MNPSTPKSSKVLSATNASTSSQKKKLKQSSLLSFFSKTSSESGSTPTKKNPIASRAHSSSAETIKVDEIEEVTITKEEKPSIISSTTKNIKDVSFSNDKSRDEETTKDLSATQIDSETSINVTANSPETDSNKRQRRINYTESDDDTDLIEDVSVSKRRRTKLFTDDDDDEDEYVPTKKELKEEQEEQHDDDDFIDDKEIASDDDDDDDEILALSEKQKSVQKAVSIPKPTVIRKPISSSILSKGKPISKPKSKASNFNKQNEERYHWLINETDAQHRPPTDPEYDCRTLFIPSSAWGKFTAFEKQYWEIKSKMWDCVVFFKKGKFFELYEKDALLANSLFDWKLAGNGRANMQLAGVPEMTFEYWASQFIEHGYKVAKVDQVESMLAKEMREGTKGIVKRELECVLTGGTLTDGDMLHSDLATYCLAVREEVGNYYSNEDYNQGKDEKSFPDRLFGVSFIDTSTGELQLLEFEDDNECTKLDTIMSQVKPKEIIMEKNNLSNLANKIVRFNASPKAIFNEIKADEEFYDYEKTYNVLTCDEGDQFQDISKWPSILRKYYEEKKKIGFSTFGALLYYLKWLKLDKNLLSMGNMKEYDAIKSQTSLILDGVTLQNLEIFSNSFDGTEKGTLFQLFNRAITPMGKRMMKKWLMHPLLLQEDIEKRLDSVDIFMSNLELRDNIESVYTKLPDLERLLSKVHTCAIKVKDFDRVIQAFEDIVKLLEYISASDVELKGALNAFIKQIPDTLYEDVKTWSNAFDRIKASEENIIIPHRGIEADFDKSLDEISALENELKEILSSYRKQFKCSNLNYKDSGKEIYTIEIPVSVAKHVPSNWVQMAANKSSKRYYSDEVRILARSMAEARETHKLLEEDLKNRLCKKFDSHFKTSWTPTIHSISNIDCILALTKTSEALGFTASRPKFVDHVDSKTGEKLNGYVKFKQLRHPCFNLGTTAARDFIPNDVELGQDAPQLGLLTGANAAGKSTVLRMTCIAVIMAQMGCYVPCEMAELTPIDRIMTRLGANDNILQGKSTFFVELSETKKILDLSTNRSLLVLDELGRGGSSSDGFAIAEGVLHHVATHIQSLGFFATHYGNLGLSFKCHPQVRPLKMSILVDDETRNVTFLYKLEDGQSEGSFGMHVATMCGIPKNIVDNAQIAADSFEHTTRLIKERELASSGIEGEIVNIPLGLQSDFVRLAFGDGLKNSALGTGEGVMMYDNNIKKNVLKNIFKIIENLGD